MKSSKIWLTGLALALALPAATWTGSGCGGGSGGSGGSGGTGGTGGTSSSSTTTSSTTTSSSSSGTGTGGTGGGTGGTGGGTGGTGATAPANDKCPGEAHTLNVGDPVLTINGTTVGATDDYKANCGDTTTAMDAPDVVYAITVMKEGNLDVVLTAPAGSALEPSLDVRTDCASTGFCSSDGTSTQTFNEDVVPGTYFVIVDGAAGSSGAFTLTAKLTAAACGDGLVNTGEDCDPGAGVANDGCGDPGTTGECKFQAAPVTQDQCPGQAIAVPAGTNMLLASAALGTSNYGFKDDYQGSCGSSPGGLDRVFLLTPAKTGTMTVSIGYEADGVTSACASDPSAPKCWAHLIYARSTCATATPELGCVVKDTDSFAPSTLSLSVTVGVPVFVFVDGYDDQNYSYGPFNLHVSLQ